MHPQLYPKFSRPFFSIVGFPTFFFNFFFFFPSLDSFRVSLVQQEGARPTPLENDVAGLLFLQAVFIHRLWHCSLAPAPLHQPALSLTCGNQAGLKPGSQENHQTPSSWWLWKPLSTQAGAAASTAPATPSCKGLVP